MGDYAYFYGSVDGDRKYGANSFSDWLKRYFTDGVFNGELRVTANGDMTVTVSPGAGQIGGKMRTFDGSQILRLETANGSLNRIDNIILRRDDTQRNFFLMVQTGAAASTPRAPELVREGNVYDLKLAEVYVKKGTINITQSSITDTRANTNVCGWITGTVKQIDFSQITAQFSQYYEEFKNSNLAEFLEWFDTIKGKLGSDVAGSLQGQIDTAMNEITGLKQKISYGTTLPTSGKEGDVFILIEG